MKLYFKRFAWKNTELKDLLQVYKEVLGDLAKEHPALDIANWQKDWLESAGTNVIQTVWKGDEVSFVQTAARAQFPTLRYHKIRVALYNKEGQVERTQDIFINNVEVTKVDLGDLTGIVAILPNYEDHGFVLVDLDEVSQKFFLGNLNLVSEPFAKTIILKVFLDMTTEGKLKSTSFLDLLLKELIPKITSADFASNRAFVNDIFSEYLTDADRATYGSLFSAKYSAILREIEDKSSDFYGVVLSALIATANSEAEIKTLHAIYLADEAGFSPRPFSLSDQWKLVTIIQNSKEILEVEKDSIFNALWKSDKSDEKLSWKRKLDGSRSRGEARVTLFKSLLDPAQTISYYELKDYLIGLNSKYVPAAEVEALVEMYVDAIPSICDNMTASQIKMFVYFFVPRVDNLEGFLAGVESAIGKVKLESTFGLKKMKQLADNLKLVIASRKL